MIQSPVLTDKEFLDTQARLVGQRVHADVPTGEGSGYRKGTVTRIALNRQALVECYGSYGTVWVSLDCVTALGAV